jgi:hypothetical protein
MVVVPDLGRLIRRLAKQDRVAVNKFLKNIVLPVIAARIGKKWVPGTNRGDALV